MKDENGDIVLYHNEAAQDIKYQDGSMSCDLPMQRISELFNVNTFIVSQVNPHTVPFIWDTIASDQVEPITSKRIILAKLVQNELKHITRQLRVIGCAPGYVDHIEKLASQTSKGHVVIVPEALSIDDYRTLLTNMTAEAYEQALQLSYVTTLKKLSNIKAFCGIEREFDRYYNRLKKKLDIKMSLRDDRDLI